MCCENNSIADGSAPPAGLFGSYACDSPLPLVQSVLNFMNSTQNGNVTFVLWTGDDTPVRAEFAPAYTFALMLGHQHNIFGQNMKDNLENIRLTSQFMRETFPNTIVVPLFGALPLHGSDTPSCSRSPRQPRLLSRLALGDAAPLRLAHLQRLAVVEPVAARRRHGDVHDRRLF